MSAGQQGRHRRRGIDKEEKGKTDLDAPAGRSRDKQRPKRIPTGQRGRRRGRGIDKEEEE